MGREKNERIVTERAEKRNGMGGKGSLWQGKVKKGCEGKGKEYKRWTTKGTFRKGKKWKGDKKKR